MTQTEYLKPRLNKLIHALQDGFIERETAVRLALLALLSGEHILLIGAPGTAKSELARRLHHAINEGDYFERLLTRFSVPEEIFGPLSIKSLEADRYHRLTKNYLPSASIAFIDEIFKANSAILNSLLTLLNEREFDNGDVREKVPLLCVVGASNELPEDDELAALYDRFLCRYEVKAVSDEQFIALLKLPERENNPLDNDAVLNLDDLKQIETQAQTIKLPDDVLALLHSLRSFLAQQNIPVSDRRWRKAVKLLQVSAYTNGQDSISVWDCWLLQHCLWHNPAQRQLILDWYQSHLGIGAGFNQERLEKLVHTWEKTLAKESGEKVQLKNIRGEFLYLDKEGKQTLDKEQWSVTERNGQPLYLAPPDNSDRTNNDEGYTFDELKEQFFDDYYQQCHIDGHWQHIDKYIKNPENQFRVLLSNQPCMQARKYPADFILKRVNETRQIADDLQVFINRLGEQKNGLSETLSRHLWLGESFMQQAESSLSETIDRALKLLQRMEKVMSGFKKLPTF